MKNPFVEFCELCDKHFCKTIKLRSVRWLGMLTCIARKSCETYFAFKKLFFIRLLIWKTMISKLANLDIHVWNNYWDYLDLPSLMQFNDPHLFVHLALLLCRFVQPSLVLQVKRGEISHDQTKGEVMKDDNILDKKLCWFVGFLNFYCFLVRCEVISLLEENETINKRQPETFC